MARSKRQAVAQLVHSSPRRRSALTGAAAKRNSVAFDSKIDHRLEAWASRCCNSATSVKPRNRRRLAALRQQAGLSQVRLARMLDIPQRKLSFYEREAEAIPSSLVPATAKAFGVTIEEVLGLEPSAQKKRGPQSQLESNWPRSPAYPARNNSNSWP